MRNQVLFIISLSSKNLIYNLQSYVLTQPKSTMEMSEQSIKVDNRHTRTTLMTTFWCLYINFEQISHIALVFPLLTLNK